MMYMYRTMTEPTLIPPTDTAPATALGSLERALAKCQEEAATAFAAANGQPYARSQSGDDTTDKHFTRGIELMKMTARLAGAMAKLNSHRSQTHFVHRTEVRALKSPPEPSLVTATPVEDDENPAPKVAFFDDKGRPRELTPEEADRFNQWAYREQERFARKRAAEEVEQGTPSPNSSGSNSANGPRIRVP